MPIESEHHAKLKRMYERAPVNVPLGTEISIMEGRAEVTMMATERMHHAASAVHGCYYFKMLDDAAFFAASSVVAEVFVLTASFTSEFFRPVSTGQLRSVGTVTKPGRTLIFAESMLYDDRGRQLAKGSGVFARSQVPLGPELGYS